MAYPNSYQKPMPRKTIGVQPSPQMEAEARRKALEEAQMGGKLAPPKMPAPIPMRPPPVLGASMPSPRPPMPTGPRATAPGMMSGGSLPAGPPRGPVSTTKPNLIAPSGDVKRMAAQKALQESTPLQGPFTASSINVTGGRQQPQADTILQTTIPQDREEDGAYGVNPINPNDLGAHSRDAPFNLQDLPVLPGAAGRPTTNEDIDQLIADFVKRQLSGTGASTAEEEALIKQKMGDELGQALVDQRASMGRAGFGSSGALAGIEADVRRKAAQGELGQILDLRKGASKEQFDRIMAAIGAEKGQREQASDEAFRKNAMDLLAAQLGFSPETGEPVGPGESPAIAPLPGAETGTAGVTPVSPENQARRDAASRTNAKLVAAANVPYVAPSANEGVRRWGDDPGDLTRLVTDADAPPPNGTHVASDDQYDYYQGASGRVYRVRH